MTDEPQTSRLANDPAMPRPGDLIGERYRIEGLLGEGGFAAVFKAYDTSTSGMVAVKVLDPLMSRRDEFAQRFHREIQTVAQLTHPNTISITDKGETNKGGLTSCLYLVMELLDGDALDTLIEERGPMPPHLVQAITEQVLRSLREAHNKQIFHRDIKPANIFLMKTEDRDEVFVKVLDFGIAKSMDGTESAKLTSTGQVMCSPHYVAPERITDHLTVAASDIYSLGISMIEMLEGAPPYEADNPLQLVMKHAHPNEPVPMAPSTRNGPLGDIIARATDKNWRTRYQSTQEMLDDLKALEGRQASGHSTQVRGIAPAPEHAAPTSTPARQRGISDPIPVDDDSHSKTGFWVVLIIAIVAGVVLAVLFLRMPLRGSDNTADTDTSAPIDTATHRPEKQKGLTRDEADAADNTQDDNAIALPKGETELLDDIIPTTETPPSTTGTDDDRPAPADSAATGAVKNQKANADTKKAQDSKPISDSDKTKANVGDNTSAPSTKPADTKPADTKPADTKPADTKPADTKPADTKPADTKPADTKPKEDRKPTTTKPKEDKKPIEIPDFGSGGYGGSSNDGTYFNK